MAGRLITADRLKELLRYEPDTGNFYWRAGTGPRSRPAGGPSLGGYWEIRIDGRDYRAHRLAWFYVTGRWPDRVDHRDCNGFNNAFANLREATVSQNRANSRPSNSTGFKGVSVRDGLAKPYRAAIEVGGKSRHLGYFATAEAAGAAYLAAAVKIHGEFARA